MNGIRLRHLVDIAPRLTKKPAAGTEVTFAPMEALADGIGGLDTSRTKPFEDVASGSYNFFEDGDVLLSKVTPCFENGKKALAFNLSNGMGFATSEVHVLRPRPGKIDPRFLIYLLSSENFKSEGIASMTGSGGLRRVSDQAVLNHRPKVTDFGMQKTIADFLDRQTIWIDALISKKANMVSLLIEKRETVISDSLKGFSKAPIGMIFFVKNGSTPKSDEPSFWNGEISWITPIDLGKAKSCYISYGYRNITIDGLNSCGTQIVPKGSIILSTRAPIGHMKIAGESMTFNQGCKGLVPTRHILSEYAYWALLSEKNTLQTAGQGTTFKELSKDKLRTIKIPLPDLVSQKEISASLMEKTANIDRVIALTRTSIERLKEYRSALITAAVTGQIDVTTYKAGQMTQDTGDADTTDQAATSTV